MKKTLANKDFFEELRQTNLEKEETNKAIEEATAEVLNDNHIIFNSHQVFARVQEKSGEKVSKR